MKNVKLFDYQGQKLSIKEIAKLNGLNFQVLTNKYKKTGDINEAVENLKAVQLGPHKYVEFFGQKMTINQIAKIYGIRWATLNYIYKLTSDIDEAISFCINSDCRSEKVCEEKMKMQKNTVSIDKLTNLDKNAFPETSLKGNDHTFLNNSIDSIEMVENNIQSNKLNEEIKKLMKCIPSRELKVLRLRYGFDGKPLVYEKIGKIMGVTKECIRQIEAKALRRLRHQSRAKYLVDYVREEPENKIKKALESLLSEKSQ